jgi:hypothetical protein
VSAAIDGTEPKTHDIPLSANDGFQNMDAPRNFADLCVIDERCQSLAARL